MQQENILITHLIGNLFQFWINFVPCFIRWIQFTCSDSLLMACNCAMRMCKKCVELFRILRAETCITRSCWYWKMHLKCLTRCVCAHVSGYAFVLLFLPTSSCGLYQIMKNRHFIFLSILVLSALAGK